MTCIRLILPITGCWTGRGTNNGKRADREIEAEFNQRKTHKANQRHVYRTCHQCGKQMIGRKQNYPYTQCGLSNVVLIDVLVFNCACGEIAVEIPAMATLHRFIAFELLRKSTLLSGEEVRFLRKFVGYSAIKFAEKIGKTPISISRWEGGKITKNADRVLRLAFFAAIIEQEAEDGVGARV